MDQSHTEVSKWLKINIILCVEISYYINQYGCSKRQCVSEDEGSRNTDNTGAAAVQDLDATGTYC